jgi:hypothetical protein
MTQEALKLALEAHEELYNTNSNWWQEVDEQTLKKIEHSITAIKEALREHAMREVQRLGQEIEQEPVADAYTFAEMRFVVCHNCGNKRCPKANDHRNACTNSNEVGQKGSSWEHVKPLAQPEHDYRTRYDRGCYKCGSHYCPADCPEPLHLVPQQPEQEPVAYWKEHAKGLQRDYDSLLADYEKLAQPEQEPVAYLVLFEGAGKLLEFKKGNYIHGAKVEHIPLYAKPQIEVGCAECGVNGGHALYCVACAEKFVGGYKDSGVPAVETGLEQVSPDTPPQRTEPVAWLEPEWGEKICPEVGFEATTTSDHPRDLCWIPLYPHPPQRTWVGLTDEEAQWLYSNCRTPSNLIDMTEAKLKEKNT